jgi:hypothetical protein
MFENYRKTFPALFVSGSCGTFVAPLMTALLLVSVSVASALAQTPQPPSNVTVPPGYSITAVTTGLNFPTAMTFYRDTIWVTEEGTATSPPAVKQIDNKGNVTTILTATMLPAGTMVSPMTGIVFDRGWIWLVHRQTAHAPPRKAEPIAFGRRSLPEIFAPPIFKACDRNKIIGIDP